MKRLFVALGLVVIAGVMLVAWSHDTDATMLRERRVKWIKTQVPALPDSDIKIRAGTAVNSAQPVDTTAAIPIWDGMEIVPQEDAVVDTFPCVITISPLPSVSTCTADTIQIAAQVSIDGTKWVAMTHTQGLTSSQLETSSNDAVYRIITIGRSWAAGGTAPTNVQLQPYRFIRFIVTGDHSGAFEAIWTYPGPSKPYTPNQ